MSAAETEYQKDFREWVFAVVGPVLIILLLGSLVFFLMEVFYQGDYPVAVHYVYGLFTVASVLISRISIVEGLERARLFGAALLLAMLIKTGLGFHSIIVLIAWWSASKLVWDCTFVDNSRDVSSQGMIQLATHSLRKFYRRFWRGEKDTESTKHDEGPADALATHQDEAEIYGDPREPLWRRILLSRKNSNTPGLWAFFFCVAGLPIFGLGQLFIENDYSTRSFCTWLFAVYMFSALGLMMVSSLIGLLRYLKSRNATMPDSIARSWVLIGTLFAFVVLGVSWMLPRPTTGISFSRSDRGSSQKESKWKSPLSERSKNVEGDSKRSGKSKRGDPNSRSKNLSDDTAESGKQPTSSDGRGNSQKAKGKKDGGSKGAGGKSNKPQNQGKSKSNSNSSKGDPKQKGKKGSPQKSGGDKKSESNRAEKNGNKNSTGNSKNPKSGTGKDSKSRTQKKSGGNRKQQNNQSSSAGKKPSQSSRGKNSQSRAEKKPESQQGKQSSTNWLAGLWSAIGTILRFLMYVVLIVAAIILAWKYRAQLIAAWHQFLKELSELWARLFQKKVAATTAGEPAAETEPLPPLPSFRVFGNPFTSDRAKSMSPDDVVHYTFQALEAWGREFGYGRPEDQTPLEFGRRIQKKHRSLGNGPINLAELYSQSVYGGGAAITAEACEPLRALWQKLEEAYHKAAPPPGVQLDPQST